MQMVGAFAAFEKSMLKERTKAGLDAAREEGRIGGRRPKLSPQQQAEIRKMVSKGDKTAADAARLFKIHPASVSRLLGERHAPGRRMPNSAERTLPDNSESDTCRLEMRCRATRRHRYAGVLRGWWGGGTRQVWCRLPGVWPELAQGKASAALTEWAPYYVRFSGKVSADGSILLKAADDFAIDVDSGSQLLDFFQKCNVILVQLLDDTQHQSLRWRLRIDLLAHP